MARHDGGGSAFGWILFGFLAGVAATLGAQILAEDARPSRHETVASTGAIHIVPQPAPPAPKHTKKHASAAPDASAAPAVAAAAISTPQDAQVADDAAAAGMTSRLPPASEPQPTLPPTITN
jgi:hypothetical protein